MLPPRIKVCGLTDPEQARAVADAGADWIGINFHPPSPRFVSEERAAAIVAALPDPERAVGVFCDRPPRDVIALAQSVGLRVIQLHGAEPPEDLVAFGAAFQVIRACRLEDSKSIDQMADYLERARRLGRVPDAVLIDAHAPGLLGGTGRTIAAALLDQLPALPNLILAGGLTPDNVAERVWSVRPWMVDVAGGVESRPGWKDLDRVRAFIAAARGV